VTTREESAAEYDHLADEREAKADEREAQTDTRERQQMEHDVRAARQG
jgi:hypothetical protein